MKRLLAFGLGAFGLRALLRRRSRARAPVDELREKLAAHRSVADESASVPAPEPVEPAVETPPPDEPDTEVVDDLDARRADVHARARRRIDELSGS